MELPWGLLPVRKAETPQRGVLRFDMEEQGYYQGDPKTLWRLVCGHWWQQECKNTKSVKFPFSLPKEITIVQTMCPVTCLFPPQTRILSKSNRLANNKSAIANQELVNPKLTTFKDAVNLNGGTRSHNGRQEGKITENRRLKNSCKCGSCSFPSACLQTHPQPWRDEQKKTLKF